MQRNKFSKSGNVSVTWDETLGQSAFCLEAFGNEKRLQQGPLGDQDIAAFYSRLTPSGEFFYNPTKSNKFSSQASSEMIKGTRQTPSGTTPPCKSTGYSCTQRKQSHFKHEFLFCSKSTGTQISSWPHTWNYSSTSLFPKYCLILSLKSVIKQTAHIFEWESSPLYVSEILAWSSRKEPLRSFVVL